MTLQELLAPKEMEFFDKHWNRLGNRKEHIQRLQHITGVHASYLTGGQAGKDFRQASIATKMSWAAGRRATKREDRAYSLLGIFDVQMSPIYGEGGQKAFRRLQRAILENSADESLFAWTLPISGWTPRPQNWTADEWGLLAPSIDCFRESGNVTINGQLRTRAFGGCRITPQGVEFPVPISEWYKEARPGNVAKWIPFYNVKVVKDGHRRRDENGFALTLNCWRLGPRRERHAVQVFLRKSGGSSKNTTWRRFSCFELGSGGDSAASSVGTIGMEAAMRLIIEQP